MPIEIRELVVKTRIGEQSTQTSPQTERTREEQAALQKKLLERCVEEVMTILNDKKER